MALELIKQKIITSNPSKNISIIRNNTNVSNKGNNGLYMQSNPTIIHYPPSIEEWNNSIYIFEKNKLTPLLPNINISVYKLLKSYFNMTPKILSKSNKNFKGWKRFSMKKTFISIPKVKHYNQKVTINIYVYNRIRLYYINKLRKLFALYTKLNMKKIFRKNKLYNKKKFYPRHVVKSIKKDWNKKRSILIHKIKNKSTYSLLLYIKHYNVKNNLSLFINNMISIILYELNRIKSLNVSPASFACANKAIEEKERIIEEKEKIMEAFYKYIFSLLLYTKQYSVNNNQSLIISNIINIVFNKLNRIKNLNMYYASFASTSKAIEEKEKIVKKKERVMENKQDSIEAFFSIFLKKLFLYKYYKFILYCNGYIFNTNNLLPLKNILTRIYKKKIELNIVNLKYLYLDSNIFAEAITSKLIDRKKRVLRVLKLGLKLTKKPFFKIHFHKDIINLKYMFYDKKLNININSTGGDLIQNKYLINKSDTYKTRLVLYHMKQKVISGIRLQGTGRLTKRLTASRSISKYKYKGSLKNLNSSYEGLSSVMLRGFVKSNLQYVNINHHNRNGSFGVKVSLSVY